METSNAATLKAMLGSSTNQRALQYALIKSTPHAPLTMTRSMSSWMRLVWAICQADQPVAIM